MTQSDTDDVETVELDAGISTLMGDVTEEVPVKMANAAAALASEHPPTNQRVLIDLIDYWTDVAGPNDPIVLSAISWLCYVTHDDVSQYDAGQTVDQHRTLKERLDELGLADRID